MEREWSTSLYDYRVLVTPDTNLRNPLFEGSRRPLVGDLALKEDFSPLGTVILQGSVDDYVNERLARAALKPGVTAADGAAQKFFTFPVWAEQVTPLRVRLSLEKSEKGPSEEVGAFVIWDAKAAIEFEGSIPPGGSARTTFSSKYDELVVTEHWARVEGLARDYFAARLEEFEGFLNDEGTCFTLERRVSDEVARRYDLSTDRPWSEVSRGGGYLGSNLNKNGLAADVGSPARWKEHDKLLNLPIGEVSLVGQVRKAELGPSIWPRTMSFVLDFEHQELTGSSTKRTQREFRNLAVSAEVGDELKRLTRRGLVRLDLEYRLNGSGSTTMELARVQPFVPELVAQNQKAAQKLDSPAWAR